MSDKRASISYQFSLDACERHADHDGPHAFKWVVETVAPLLYWLDHSSDRQVERFQALEKAGSKMGFCSVW